LFFHLKNGSQKTDISFAYFLKSTWETDENFPVIDKFCWSVRDRIANLDQLASEAKPTANLSNAEKSMLKKLISTKNQKVIINDTD
jgi:hypothetical protein